MQQVFHGNCALYSDFVAAQQRQNADLARAARRRMMQEHQATSSIDTTLRHRIGALLIEMGTRLGGVPATRTTNAMPIAG